MFKRRVEDSGRISVFRFSCKLFYAHICNVLIMLVTGMLVGNLSLLKIEVSDAATPAAVTVVCFLFYVIYIYIQCWRVGQRDYNLVLYKHEEYSRFKPLLAAVFSQLPGLVFVILVQFPGLGFDAVRYARFYYLDFNYVLLYFGESHPLLYFVPVFIAPLLAPAAYHMGYRGIYLANKLVYKNADRRKKDRP